MSGPKTDYFGRDRKGRLVSDLLARVPRRWRNRLRGAYERAKLRWISEFRSYGPAELVACLRSLGIREGDTVILHSAFEGSSGFEGSPGMVADSFLEALGPGGNLLMVSLPSTGASFSYLNRVTLFDVRNTPSRMGLVSEFFRRREGVLRSLHPSHPILAFGPEAAGIVAGHERCLFPCGPGTPFDRAVDLDGKVVFFDTGLDKMTFFHWLEHRVQGRVGLPLYQEEIFEVPVVDHEGKKGTVRTYAFSQEVIARRRDYILHDEMWKKGIVKSGRVGNTRILVSRLREIVRCVDEMADRGLFFYEFR